MNKKNIIFGFLAAVILVVSLYSVYLLISNGGSNQVASTSNKKTNEVILYWGVGCPHCEKLEEYLKANKNIEQKIKIERKEVFKNKANAVDLENKATSCNLDTSSGMGVPFLYYKGECLLGDKPIIDYLNKKAS